MGDILVPILILVIWVLLQVYVLPKLGIDT